MSFSIFERDLILCSGDNVLIYNLDDDSEKKLFIPKSDNKKEAITHNKEDIENLHSSTYVSFSDHGNYLLICTNRKQLCLFHRKNYEIISNRSMVRAISSVKFTSNNEIVAADKSGDAYLFSTKNPEINGKLLLGHLSMLLDLLVTEDEKFIITADRDEKIRVSYYPNCYNIHSYCLGHQSFVTNISILPHDKNILISCGGDGKLIFWDFKNGKELLTEHIKDKIPQSDIDSLKESLEKYGLNSNITVSPVKHLRTSKISENMSLLSLSYFCSGVILIYSAKITENKLDVKYLKSVILSKEPLDCFHFKNQLWVLTDDGLSLHPLEESSINDNLNEKISKVNETWKKIHNTADLSLISVLYKRKFDNAQEYQEKKKIKIERKI